MGSLLSGAAQIGWGLLLPFRASVRQLPVGGLPSLLFIGAWLLSRTVGLPMGPGAFFPEPVGVADVLCCAPELGTTVGALLLIRRAGRPAGERGRRVQAVLALSLGLLLVGGTTSVALASPAAHEPGAAPASGPAGTGRARPRRSSPMRWTRAASTPA